MTRTVRLDIRDLPRDPDHCQGQLRTELIKMANYVRKFPKKAASLVVVLEAALAHVAKNIDIENGEIEEVLAPTLVEQLTVLMGEVASLGNKNDVVAQAAKVGLELSTETGRDALNVALVNKYQEIIALQEGK